MNSEQKQLTIALITGIVIGVSIGWQISVASHKPPVSIQLDTPKQCTIKIGNVLVQGNAYHE